MMQTSTFLPTGCLPYVANIGILTYLLISASSISNFLISMFMLFTQNLIIQHCRQSFALSIGVYKHKHTNTHACTHTRAYLKHHLFVLVQVYVMFKRNYFLLLSVMCLLFLSTWYTSLCCSIPHVILVAVATNRCLQTTQSLRLLNEQLLFSVCKLMKWTSAKSTIFLLGATGLCSSYVS